MHTKGNRVQHAQERPLRQAVQKEMVSQNVFALAAAIAQPQAPQHQPVDEAAPCMLPCAVAG